MLFLLPGILLPASSPYLPGFHLIFPASMKHPLLRPLLILLYEGLVFSDGAYLILYFTLLIILLSTHCSSVQFSSVAQSCLTLCDPMNCSTPGLPVHHQLLESTQTHVHWVGDAIQPSHLLSSPSPPALSLSQHQGLFKWVSSSHQVARILEFQLQHQFF